MTKRTQAAARRLRRLFILIVGAGVVFGLLLLGQATVHCQIRSDYPPLTPAQAADVLRRAPGLANLTGVGTSRPPTGPTFGSTGSRGPTAGPWDWPAPTPARRLDGTLVDSPVQVYGLQPWWVTRQNGPLPRERRNRGSR